MNNLLPFEKLLGGKLRELPVPDCKAAIWEKISMDLQNAEKTNHKAISTKSPPFTVWLWIGAGALVAALTLATYRNKNKPAKPSPKYKPKIENRSLVKQGKGALVPINEKFVKQSAKPDNRNDFQVGPPLKLPEIPPVTGILYTTPYHPPTVLDSLTPPTAFPGFQETKQNWGIKGINDSNYRVTIQNDSLN